MVTFTDLPSLWLHIDFTSEPLHVCHVVNECSRRWWGMKSFESCVFYVKRINVSDFAILFKFHSGACINTTAPLVELSVYKSCVFNDTLVYISLYPDLALCSFS